MLLNSSPQHMQMRSHLVRIGCLWRIHLRRERLAGALISACLCSYRKGEVWTEKWRHGDAISGTEAWALEWCNWRRQRAAGKHPETGEMLRADPPSRQRELTQVPPCSWHTDSRTVRRCTLFVSHFLWLPSDFFLFFLSALSAPF